MKIIDIKDMPDFNPSVKNGIDSVSTGKVSIKKSNTRWYKGEYVACHIHNAMLCVSQDRRIFRCPECNVGAYRSEF